MADGQLYRGLSRQARREDIHMRKSHNYMRAKGYGDGDDLSMESGYSEISTLSDEVARTLQVGGRRRKCRARPKVPGSSSPPCHAELVHALSREPPVGSPSSPDLLVSPVNETASLPPLREEDSVPDNRAITTPSYRRAPMATLNLPSLASRGGSVAYDSISNHSSSSWQTSETSDSLSFTSGASGEYPDSCSETSSLRLAPTPSSTYAMTRHQWQRQRGGDPSSLEVPRRRAPRRPMTTEQFAEKLIRRLEELVGEREAHEEALGSVKDIPSDTDDDVPSPESRGTESSNGTLKQPMQVAQAKQISNEHRDARKQSSYGLVKLDESHPEYSRRVDELLKLMPQPQPVAPEALMAHQRYHPHLHNEGIQPRDPNDGFPGDGQSLVSVVSFSSSSRQRRRLDAGVEEELKGSIQMMISKQPQVKQVHPSRQSRRHRQSGGGSSHSRDPEPSTEHPHIVHEHRHIHEHYFKGHTPDGLHLTPSQTADSSTMHRSWHHEYSMSHSHSSVHEKTTSQETIYHIAEKSTHGRDRPVGGTESSRRSRQAAEHEGTTTIMYVLDDRRTPLVLTVPGTEVTLGDFKREVQLNPRASYRYYFKRADAESETGVVLEEIRNDNRVLPLFKGRIISRIQRVCR